MRTTIATVQAQLDALRIENAKLLKEKEEFRYTDQRVRTEISRSLGVQAVRDNYGNEKEYAYSWFEIFREIGKLLSKENYANWIYDLRSHKQALEEVKDIQNKIIHEPDFIEKERLVKRLNNF